MGAERGSLYWCVFPSVVRALLTSGFAACGTYAHAKCAGYLQSSCNANGHDDQLLPNGPPMFGNDLVSLRFGLLERSRR